MQLNISERTLCYLQAIFSRCFICFNSFYACLDTSVTTGTGYRYTKECYRGNCMIEKFSHNLSTRKFLFYYRITVFIITYVGVFCCGSYPFACRENVLNCYVHDALTMVDSSGFLPEFLLWNFSIFYKVIISIQQVN